MREPKADPERVEIVEKKTVFQGYFQVDRYLLKHRTFEGGWSPVISREIFERGHAASVLPYDPERDAVVLIEQFRAGALAAGLGPWLIEIVAGIIGPGETAEEVVRREAIEEMGRAVTDLEPICTYLLTPGGSSETLAMFCGRVDSDGAGGIHGLDEEGEDIRVLVRSVDEAIAMLNDGTIFNANAVLALQWLALNREGLRRRWLG